MFDFENDQSATTRRAMLVKVDDKGSQQLVDLKGVNNEEPQKIWRPQPFGISSNPPKDSDGLLHQLGSRSDRSVYQDGGHEKYRPKRTPVGGTVLYDDQGNIIRIFKDHGDFVHSKKINIRIGKGYKAGDNGKGNDANDTSEDDQSHEDTKSISIAMDGDKIIIGYESAKVTLSENSAITEFGDSSCKLENGKATLTSPHVVVDSASVDLGGEGGEFVKLASGANATKVRAV